MSIPATIKIIVSFIFILLITRKKCPLSISLILGAILLDFWAGSSAIAVAHHLGQSLQNPEVWLMVVIIFLLLRLAAFITQPMFTHNLIGNIRAWSKSHGRAIGMMLLPATIGLIPMPGGALVSAPMVQQIMPEEKWKPEWKAAVNYWFRHVWEYWWPLFPVVVLSLSIFDMATWQYLACMIPFSLTAIAAGYFFLIRPYRHELKEAANHEHVERKPVWMIFLPLCIVVMGTLLFPYLLTLCFPELPQNISKLCAMSFSILLALVTLLCSPSPGKKHMAQGMFSKQSINQLFLLASVVVFRDILEYTGVLGLSGQEIYEAGLPFIFVAAFLPFLAGLVTGIAIGFAGVAFPFILGMMDSGATNHSVFSILCLSFGFGYVGMLLSPVHLCLIMSKEYFETHLSQIYKTIALPTACIAALSLALYVAL